MSRMSLAWAAMALLVACNTQPKSATVSAEVSSAAAPFFWENATVYFALTDRFFNGDTSNDTPVGRFQDGAPLRSYHGGDLRGVIQKLEAGYFANLGVNALWLTPQYENIHGFTDEGTGKTYAFHGYWPKDWTKVDPNLGSMADYKELVDKAHAQGIRVIMDVIINHTGPANEADPAWPAAWVREDPSCTFQDQATCVTCTLVDNLPDIKTESEEPVDLPPSLVVKWQTEGRYEEEIAELDEFFAATGYPRAPKYYIIKWLIDYVKELGIDGFRIDTAKHVEPGVWGTLYREAVAALKAWREAHPESPASEWDQDFYMVGEIYGYAIGHGREYPFNDTERVDFFTEGFKAMINFSLKGDAHREYEEVFSDYNQLLHEGPLAGLSTLNYISSHDDGGPYDRMREHPYRAANFLLLSPGGAQIYYGDETSRVLDATEQGAQGDAHLRTPMNWDMLAQNDTVAGEAVRDVLAYWAKLGQFRRQHPAIGAGTHHMLSAEPYVFARSMRAANDYQDDVVIAIGDRLTEVSVGEVFPEGTVLQDHYSGAEVTVTSGKVTLSTGGPIVLLSQK